jgi:hypothetical protein
MRGVPSARMRRATTSQEGRKVVSKSRSGLPAIPPMTVHLLPFKTCWGCGGPATVSIRPLSLRFHRFYCHACARLLSSRRRSG